MLSFETILKEEFNSITYCYKNMEITLIWNFVRISGTILKHNIYYQSNDLWTRIRRTFFVNRDVLLSMKTKDWCNYIRWHYIRYASKHATFQFEAFVSNQCWWRIFVPVFQKWCWIITLRFFFHRNTTFTITNWSC